MGWFSEQIKQRKEKDDEVFNQSFVDLATAVMGSRISAAFSDESQLTKSAMDEILKFYHVKSQEIPDEIKDQNEKLEFLLRPYGIMRRTVNLSKGWFKDAIGAMIAQRKTDSLIVALIPTGLSGYSYRDPDTGKMVRINSKNEGLFETEAISFYKPFPLRKIGIKELIGHIIQTLSISDFIVFALATLAVVLLGMLTPKVVNIIFGRLVGNPNLRLWTSMLVFLICLSFSNALLVSIKALLMARVSTKMEVSIQAATMMRIMSLPPDFFKDFGSGELSSRANYISTLCNLILSTIFSTGLMSLFSLVYITQITRYTPSLLVISLLTILTSLVFSIIFTLIQIRITRQQMELSSKDSGMSYALISGIQKIKLAGAEKRAFSRWGKIFSREAKLLYNPPTFLKLNSTINLAISLLGTIAIYYISVKAKLTAADYYSFSTAYSMVWGAFMSLSSVAASIAKIKPTLEMAKPILDAVPEVSEGKQVLSRISGGIELSNVSFRYSEKMPLIIDNLSLKIRSGEYIAIVGSTGCGKSTLMRLMLGFETPQKGAIYYDGKDLNTIDLKSLRKKIGTVMQNGKLFFGDIFSNITISAPWLSLAEAWEAAEASGLADDIKRMPMGMHTIISEGSGGISGGQRQRLQIARAIAPKPKILMFDEATSALDNLTQKKISDSLAALKCTRIVIAHRLSTIRECDRIIVLEHGRIIEDGTYDSLIKENGFFASLVSRQRLD